MMRRLVISITAALAALAALAIGPAAPGPGTIATAGTEAPVAAEPARGRIVRVVQPRSEMVGIPGGLFTMGLTEADIEGLFEACQLNFTGDLCALWGTRLVGLTARKVHVDAFAIDRYEVTAGQYRACASAGGCSIDALVAGDERYLADDRPMVNITWAEAGAFCAWAAKRLPTEAEWEKAARGTDERRWPWGDQERPDDWNHGRAISEVERRTEDTLNVSHRHFPLQTGIPDDSDGFQLAAPPGSLRWGEGPYGTFDQAGNVAEWVEDAWVEEGYEGLPTTNPVRPTTIGGTPARVFRGGSWVDPVFLGRASLRSPINPWLAANQRHPWLGFRCARDL